MIIEQLHDRDVKVNYLQMSNFELMLGGIKSGIGIAFLPRSVVENEFVRKGLSVMQVSSFRIMRKNGLVIRKDALLSDEESSFIQVVKEYFKHQENRTLMEN